MEPTTRPPVQLERDGDIDIFGNRTFTIEVYTNRGSNEAQFHEVEIPGRFRERVEIVSLFNTRLRIDLPTPPPHFSNAFSFDRFLVSPDERIIIAERRYAQEPTKRFFPACSRFAVSTRRSNVSEPANRSDVRAAERDFRSLPARRRGGVHSRPAMAACRKRGRTFLRLRTPKPECLLLRHAGHAYRAAIPLPSRSGARGARSLRWLRAESSRKFSRPRTSTA